VNRGKLRKKSTVIMEKLQAETELEHLNGRKGQ